eukprot:Skav208355  [mRNA]  locus=scaffold1964:166638:167488:- [translate_table: standard]
MRRPKSSSWAQVNYMKELYEKTFILSGERLGRIMVQSVQDQGLCSVFNQIIGFSGDEFYIAPAEDQNSGCLTAIKLMKTHA